MVAGIRQCSPNLTTVCREVLLSSFAKPRSYRAVGAAPSAIENSQKLSIDLHERRSNLPNNHSSCLSVLGDHNLNRNRTSLRISGGQGQTF